MSSGTLNHTMLPTLWPWLQLPRVFDHDVMLLSPITIIINQEMMLFYKRLLKISNIVVQAKLHDVKSVFINAIL